MLERLQYTKGCSVLWGDFLFKSQSDKFRMFSAVIGSRNHLVRAIFRKIPSVDRRMQRAATKPQHSSHSFLVQNRNTGMTEMPHNGRGRNSITGDFGNSTGGETFKDGRLSIKEGPQVQMSRLSNLPSSPIYSPAECRVFKPCDTGSSAVRTADWSPLAAGDTAERLSIMESRDNTRRKTHQLRKWKELPNTTSPPENLLRRLLISVSSLEID